MDKPLIIAFDILPQSSPIAHKSPRYAMVISNGQTHEIMSSIRRSEMLKTIRRVKPDIIASDNLLELASSEKSLIDVLSKIPSKTRVIQVTGSPIHGMTSLMKLSKRHGLPVKKHPTPVESAILISQLAFLGVGTEVSVLARETIIRISRARNIGPGGFSQARYQRRMHGAIQQVARNILEKLTKAKMDYDQFETRTSHGWSRCVIHVYDSFDNVSRVAQSESNRIAGVTVRISPVKHRSILYLPREDKEEPLSPRQFLIVGIDSGTTVGIAISNVSGRLIALRSGRGLSRGDVIRYLVEYGKPILFAADVSPAPSFIDKISKSLKTPIFVPEKLLSVSEKRALVKSFTKDSDFQPKNAHQRDALAAIAKVFQIYGKKIAQLRKRLDASDQQHLVSEAITVLLRGGSVHDAFDQSIVSVELKEISPKFDESVIPSQKIPAKKELQQLIIRLKRQAVSLKRQLEYEKSQHHLDQELLVEMKKKYQRTQRQLNRLLTAEQREQRRDALVGRKNAEIARLRKKIQQINTRLDNAERTITNLKLMRQLEIRGEVQPILVLSQFSQEEFRRFSERYSKKRARVVLIQDPSGGGSSTAEQLIQFGVQVVISEGTMSHLALEKFSTVHIPVIDAKKLRITIVDEFAVVDVEQLHKEIRKWQKDHQVAEREAAADVLERLIEEYRQERRHEDSRRK